jgi:predicted NAD/FAD-dependent oxidoreductase
VVVFEKSPGLGGRCATRRVGPYTFDTGATSIAPRGRSLEPVMLAELDTSDLVKIEKPIWTMRFGRTAPGDATKMAIERYTYRSGSTMLAKLLADGLDVRLGAMVAAIERDGEAFRINEETFDAVVLTMPSPQAIPLLEKLGEERAIREVRYRSCLSVLLGYPAPFDAPYHALVDPDQRHPVIWVSAESVKSPDRAPEGHSAFVAQFGADYSRTHYEDSDAEIAHEAKVALDRLTGGKLGAPEVVQVKRWRFSQPEITTTFERTNPAGTRVVIATDAVSGPRVEFAYEAGARAAAHLMESLKS